jgi:hypothetical protein
MITERIIQVLEQKGITKYKFCKDLGFSNGFLDKPREITTDKYANILEYFQDIDPIWLLTGKGEMIKDTHNNANSTNVVSEPPPMFGGDKNDLIKELITLQRECNEKGNRIIEQSDLINKLKEEIATLRNADGAARNIA